MAAGATVASAESLTGGELAGLLSATPGASATYVGGVVAYATAVKTSVLGVPADLVARDGTVSDACAAAMAEGVRRLIGATWGVATTGVAGPEPQEGKPVGLVYVGVAGPGGPTSVELRLAGTRSEIRRDACARALAEVLRQVVGEDG